MSNMSLAAASGGSASVLGGFQPLDDPFELGVMEVTDQPITNSDDSACDTNDGCKPTCASACTGSSS